MRTTAMMIEALERYRSEPNHRHMEEFWRVVERYRADLYNQALLLLRHPEDAEDVVQETLRVAFLKLGTLEDSKIVNRWLRTINRNIALRLLRRRRMERKATKRMEAIAADAPSAGTPADADADAELREQIVAAIDSLPESLRAVVVLRYWERLSYEQIAERLALPIGTVGSRMVRADRLMRRRLSRYLRSSDAPEATEGRLYGHGSGGEAGDGVRGEEPAEGPALASEGRRG